MTTWSAGTLPLPPLSGHLVSSGLATPPYSRAPPTSHPSVLGAGLRLSLCGQGRARPPGSQAGLAVGPTWCHPEGCRSQSMSRLSQPGAVQLSAPGNEAESGEWTLPGISLIHSFSLPKSLHRLLQCARQVSSAPCRARPAGGSRHSPGQGVLEAEPCPEEPATTDRRAPSSPWPMGRTRRAPCSQPLSIWSLLWPGPCGPLVSGLMGGRLRKDAEGSCEHCSDRLLIAQCQGVPSVLFLCRSRPHATHLVWVLPLACVCQAWFLEKRHFRGHSLGPLFRVSQQLPCLMRHLSQILEP